MHSSWIQHSDDKDEDWIDNSGFQSFMVSIPCLKFPQDGSKHCSFVLDVRCLHNSASRAEQWTMQRSYRDFQDIHHTLRMVPVSLASHAFLWGMWRNTYDKYFQVFVSPLPRFCSGIPLKMITAITIAEHGIRVPHVPHSSHSSCTKNLVIFSISNFPLPLPRVCMRVLVGSAFINHVFCINWFNWMERWLVLRFDSLLFVPG